MIECYMCALPETEAEELEDLRFVKRGRLAVCKRCLAQLTKNQDPAEE